MTDQPDVPPAAPGDPAPGSDPAGDGARGLSRLRSGPAVGPVPAVAETATKGTHSGGTDPGGTDTGGTDPGGTDQGGTDVGRTNVGRMDSERRPSEAPGGAGRHREPTDAHLGETVAADAAPTPTDDVVAPAGVPPVAAAAGRRGPSRFRRAAPGPPSAAPPHPGEPVHSAVPRTARRGLLPAPAAPWVPWLTALVAVGVALAPLLPHARLRALFGYDEGVYAGAATQVLHGHLPYADFALLHPTGSTVLLLPAALLGHLTGGAGPLLFARLTVIAAAGVTAAAASRLLAHRGTGAALLAGLAVALLPAGVTGTSSATLEPLVGAAALSGLVALGRGLGPAAGRRTLLWAGALLGLATAVKLWGVLLLAGAVLALLTAGRPAALRAAGRLRRAGTLLAGAGGAFAVLVGPFALRAPGAFAHDVLVSQLDRGRTAGSPGVLERLGAVGGLEQLSGRSVGGLAAGGCALALAAVAVLGLDGARRRTATLGAAGPLTGTDLSAVPDRAVTGPPADTVTVPAAAAAGAEVALRALAWGSAALVALVCGAGQFYAYYAYLPQLCSVVVVAAGLHELWLRCAGRAWAAAGPTAGTGTAGAAASPGGAAPRPAGRTRRAQVATGAAAALSVAAVAAGAGPVAHYVSGYTAEATQVAPTVAAAVPAGACAIADEPALLLLADRFGGGGASCPAVVDPFGAWVASDPAHVPNPSAPTAGIATAWTGWLLRAQYLVLSVPQSSFVPFQSPAGTVIRDGYTLISANSRVYVYQRTAG